LIVLVEKYVKIDFNMAKFSSLYEMSSDNYVLIKKSLATTNKKNKNPHKGA
jgi:tRNA A-37 threonylcarbamoyl transferase component Bud32